MLETEPALPCAVVRVLQTSQTHRSSSSRVPPPPAPAVSRAVRGAVEVSDVPSHRLAVDNRSELSHAGSGFVSTRRASLPCARLLLSASRPSHLRAGAGLFAQVSSRNAGVRCCFWFPPGEENTCKMPEKGRKQRDLRLVPDLGGQAGPGPMACSRRAAACRSRAARKDGDGLPCRSSRAGGKTCGEGGE